MKWAIIPIEPSTLLPFCLSSRYYSSSVAKQRASLGPVRLLLSVLPLYSFKWHMSYIMYHNNESLAIYVLLLFSKISFFLTFHLPSIIPFQLYLSATLHLMLICLPIMFYFLPQDFINISSPLFPSMVICRAVWTCSSLVLSSFLPMSYSWVSELVSCCKKD